MTLTSLLTLNPTTYQLALTAAYAAEERKAGDIVLLDVQPISTLADYFILATGYSTTQVRAISRSIEEKMLEEWSQLPLRVEGQQSSTWILMDYADLIIHIMIPQEREFYDLETFWGQAHRIRFPIAG